MASTQDASSRLKGSFQKVVDSIARDIPVLMHGSGDVSADQVDPATAQLVSALTAQYIGHLVDAAIDSHDMLRDSQVDLPLVPPPSFPRSRKPPIPTPPDSKKRRRITDDYWDEPLPEPKIKGQAQPSVKPSGGGGGGGEDDTATTSDWVGAAGVDLWEESRARAAYCRGNAGLSTQSFIFPICHDVYAYGRVTEVQAASRAVAPLLLDPILMDMVRTEGKVHHAPPTKKKKTTASGSDEPEDDNDEEDNAEDEPAWPGLESLLPVHAYLADA